MDTDTIVCEVCGQPALVRVLVAYRDGKPDVRDYCAGCADRADDEAWQEGPSSEPRIRVITVIFIELGLVCGMLAVLADYLGIGDASGFGWQQQAAFGLGGLLVVAGALMKIEVVSIIGVFTIVLTVGADYLKLGASSEIGWKQQLAVLFSAMLILAGIMLRRAHRESPLRKTLPSADAKP